jgi:hypothetical protein
LTESHSFSTLIWLFSIYHPIPSQQSLEKISIPWNWNYEIKKQVQDEDNGLSQKPCLLQTTVSEDLDTCLTEEEILIGLAVLSGSKLSLKAISNSILIYILLNKLLYNHWNQSEKMGVLWDEYSSSSKDEIGFIVLQWWWEKEQRWYPLCEEIV